MHGILSDLYPEMQLRELVISVRFSAQDIVLPTEIVIFYNYIGRTSYCRCNFDQVLRSWLQFDNRQHHTTFRYYLVLNPSRSLSPLSPSSRWFKNAWNGTFVASSIASDSAPLDYKIHWESLPSSKRSVWRSEVWSTLNSNPPSDRSSMRSRHVVPPDVSNS